MPIRRLLIGMLITLSAVFLVLQMLGLEVEATGARALFFVILTTYYVRCIKTKYFFFRSFLIIFTVAAILTYVGWFIPLVPYNEVDYMYYFINSLYVISYSLLIWQVLAKLNLLEVLRTYPIHLIILIVLDVFSVIVVTNTTLDRLSFHEYSMELIYNIVIMILLTASLINFIHRHDKKAINLLVGSIFIFFSEVIQMAYFYVSDINLLNVISSIFLLLAFLFFLVQAQVSPQPQERAINV